jgi:hypothetical protein
MSAYEGLAGFASLETVKVQTVSPIPHASTAAPTRIHAARSARRSTPRATQTSPAAIIRLS